MLGLHSFEPLDASKHPLPSLTRNFFNSQFSILKQTPPLLRSTPSNSEGDVHGAVHTISTTPPSLLLGGAAERNFDHPSQPPLS